MFGSDQQGDYINSTSTTATSGAAVAGKGAELSADDSASTFFASSATGSSAELQLDVGSLGPYFDTLINITIYNRQDGSCQDRLQCFCVDLYSELDVFLETRCFGGADQSVYVIYFYLPPSPPPPPPSPP